MGKERCGAETEVGAGTALLCATRGASLIQQARHLVAGVLVLCQPCGRSLGVLPIGICRSEYVAYVSGAE